MVRLKVLLVAAVAVLAVSCPVQAWWTYVSDFQGVGTYDEQVKQTNAVDREAAGNTKSLAQFKTDIATAWAADKGGICTFDIVQGYEDGAGVKRPGLSPDGGGRGRNIFTSDGDYPGGASEMPTLRFGISQTQSVEIRPARALEIWPQLTYTSVGLPVSGASYGVGGQVWNSGALCTPETNWWPGDNTQETITFSQGLAEMAVTLISKDDAYLVDLWVKHADDTLSTRSLSIAAGAGGDDVFVHFEAGSSPIVAFHWASNVSRPPIDDLAVIVVPEPATMSLLALGGMGVLIKRKRR